MGDHLLRLVFISAFSAAFLSDLCGKDLNFDFTRIRLLRRLPRASLKATGSDSTARWCFAQEVWAASSRAEH